MPANVEITSANGYCQSRVAGWGRLISIGGCKTVRKGVPPSHKFRVIFPIQAVGAQLSFHLLGRSAGQAAQYAYRSALRLVRTLCRGRHQDSIPAARYSHPLGRTVGAGRLPALGRFEPQHPVVARPGLGRDKCVEGTAGKIEGRPVFTGPGVKPAGVDPIGGIRIRRSRQNQAQVVAAV